MSQVRSAEVALRPPGQLDGWERPGANFQSHYLTNPCAVPRAVLPRSLSHGFLCKARAFLPSLHSRTATSEIRVH